MNDRLNCYTCKECNYSIVTIDRDEGVTPMFLACRNPKKCAGTMQSHGYRGVIGTPTHEWRRPPRAERRKMSTAMQEYFRKGGLELYEIKMGAAV